MIYFIKNELAKQTIKIYLAIGDYLFNANAA